MAYTGTITTEPEIALMSGENVDATGATETNNNLLVAQAEAFLSALIQDDVKTNFSSYDSTTKQILSEYASRYAGMQLILYNTDGFVLESAEDIINVHAFRMREIETQLLQGNVLKQLGATD